MFHYFSQLFALCLKSKDVCSTLEIFIHLHLISSNTGKVIYLSGQPKSVQFIVACYLKVF